ncbi:MAG: SDR family NAD(P)-dependent oxidoreductase [Gemmatimonadaceae bacterium]|nr:SDR family NAD(P)-dependent oxidoreductase [Gemmatimonadaceae bacterium]
MSSEHTGARRAIAIVGMSGRFPGAPTLRQFWENLRNGVESLDTFTAAELDAAGINASIRALPGWVSRGTVLEDADCFDATFFGYAPREAQIIDPQQRVFLECAWEALEDAGYAGEPDGRTIAIYAGSSLNSYVVTQLLPNRDLLESVGGYQLMLGNDKDFLTTRASYKLDLHGPSMSIQTACSTSLVAVQVACQALLRNECDMAMAGGVSISFPQRTGYQYQEGMIFSPDGHCRPFDVDARGTRAGAGAGIVVLKRLEDAIADRDTIQAVILGAAINNDGAGKAGYTAPSVDGQMEVIATAQALTGVTPDTISYVEAHGTATPLGDPIEVAALTRVFREGTESRGFCTIGSLKANLGHLDAAAGVAGLIKTVLALRHRELPPQLNFSAPNPQLQLDTSPFRVATSLETWDPGRTPRRAGVSSFGIGGTNAHVVLEEAPPIAPRTKVRAPHLVVLSARTEAALDAATTRLIEYLGRADAAPLADVAYTLQVGRRTFAHRRSVVARDAMEARALLSVSDRAPVVNGVHDGASRPVAFLFSGQGSQHAGMCRELYDTESVFRGAVDRCAELMHPHFGRDIRELLRNGTDGELSETYVAQPVLVVTGYALAVLWMSWGVQPSAMIGHSIGEYVAAHLAGVFSLEDALMLVCARGHLMQGMAPGDMLAVRLAPAEIRARLHDGIELAAVNAPALCTVSGTREAIESLTIDLERAGIEHRPLHTSHAFHSAMMEPALAPFREIVARVTLTAPRRPYVSNVTGTWIRNEQATSPDYWVAHLRSAVLFADGITTLAADPTMQLLEVGAGNALTSLARLTLGRDGATRVTASLPHPREPRGQLETMLSAAGRLWASGVAIDWSDVHADEVLYRVSLPTYPFERQRHWVDAPAVTAAANDAVRSLMPARHETVKDWFHQPTWTSAPLARTRLATLTGAWLVFGRGDALDAAVRAGLLDQGAIAISVTPGAHFAQTGDRSYTVRPIEAADHEELLRALKRSGHTPRGVLHLWNVGATDVAPEHDAVLHSLMALGRAILLDSSSEPVRLVVATSGAASAVGEPITHPHRALANGPVLVFPAEHESMQSSTIDLDGRLDGEWVQTASAAIIDDARADDADQFVAMRSGRRLALRYESTSLPAVAVADLPLHDGGVYLVTGGLGGIGATFAEWLALRARARLVLTSRSALPPRDEWDAWVASHEATDVTRARIDAVRRIEAAGADVMVAVVDVTDGAGMRGAVVEAQERWGPIHGVVHAAGVPDVALMATYSWDEAAACIAAKVRGTQILTEILGDTPLDFVLLCSSINAVFGYAGSTAYTAANAYLDAFVASAQKPTGWRTVSIAWDVWRDVGMAMREVDPSAARKLQVETGITPSDGIDAFLRVFASGHSRFVVSPYDIQGATQLRHRLRSSLTGSSEVQPLVPRQKVPTPRASSSLLTGPVGDIETQLAAVWEDLLGVTPVGVHDNFFELGGHSLLATRVLARIDSFFGVRLALRTMFEAPTIRQLGVVIATEQATASASAVMAAPDGDREEFEL